MFSPLCALLGRAPREPESELDQFTMDVARSLQVVLEEILLEKAAYLHQQCSRGCAWRAASRSTASPTDDRSRGTVRDSSFNPRPDAGGALGAAAMATVRMTGGRRGRAARPRFLGPAYRLPRSRALLAAAGQGAGPRRRGRAHRARGRQLARGKVIGWFRGAMEFGPRALGARSILADPRDPEMRDRINALSRSARLFVPSRRRSWLSERTTFRARSPRAVHARDLPGPFGARPTGDHARRRFGARRRPSTRAPIRAFALLRAFDRRTGCPLLLNTSFNLRGEPIVCSPVDALLCFARSEIDSLVLEDFVIDRPMFRRPGWSRFATRVLRCTGVPGTVYTLL